MIAGPAESSDAVVAALAADGDDAAFEALVARYQHRVFRLACRLTGETHVPDVVQETLLQRHLSAFRGEAYRNRTSVPQTPLGFLNKPHPL